MNISDLYKKETGKTIYRKTKLDTLVYDEEYVHWLQEKVINSLTKVQSN